MGNTPSYDYFTQLKIQKNIQKNNTHNESRVQYRCTADAQNNPAKGDSHTTGPDQNPTPPKPRGSTSGVMVPDFSALLSLGTGVIRRWWLGLLLLAAPVGNPPAVGQCVCVRPHREGRMSAIEHPAAAPAPCTPYPAPLPLPSSRAL